LAVSLRGTFIVRNFTQGRLLIRGCTCVNAQYFVLEAAFGRLSHSIATYISCNKECTSTVLSAIFNLIVGLLPSVVIKSGKCDAHPVGQERWHSQGSAR
jgi:hypothetical protein